MSEDHQKKSGTSGKAKTTAILYAIAAAVFYALNTPFSKLLLASVPATFMASFLYLGAGLGVGIMYLFHWKQEAREERLSREDLPYTLGMIALDILAPILLMLGIRMGTASNASLLGNFEIVATSLIALLLFKEQVSKRLWIAIGLITLASLILTVGGTGNSTGLSGESVSGSLHFSVGSLLVLLAASCWGLENNCTRSISGKSTYEIVTLKGLCSGAGSFLIAVVSGEKLPEVKYIVLTMLLGFVAYGLSIFTYVRAQRDLGAARTSAYYAIAPFIAALLSMLVCGEPLTFTYAVALIIMIFGTVFVVKDTR